MVQRFGEPDPSFWEYVLGRHAKAEHNIVGDKATFAGGRIDSELSNEGKEEIKDIIEKIITDGGCDLIVCSTMKRSQETAEIVAQGIEEQLDRRPEVKIIQDLQEIDVGNFTGNTTDWAREHYSEAADNFYNGEVAKWDFPEGENYETISQRVRSVIAQLREIAEPGQKVVIIGHGMFNRVFLSIIFPEKEELWRPTAYPHDRLIAFQVPNEISVQ